MPRSPFPGGSSGADPHLAGIFHEFYRVYACKEERAAQGPSWMLSMIKGMQRADKRRALSYLSKARGELLHELSLEGPPEVKMDRGMWPAVTEAMLSITEGLISKDESKIWAASTSLERGRSKIHTEYYPVSRRARLA